MSNFILKLREFMAGRYGFDQLGRFLFGLSVVFWLASGVLRWTPFRKVYFVFWLLNTLLYVFAIFRILSRNTYARTVENERYLHLRQKVWPFFEKRKAAFRERQENRDYLFKACPYCNTKLRLRRIKGKHTSRCPKCGKTFSVRVWRGQ